MAKGDGERDGGFGKVPLWNGRAEDFQHYVQDVKWYLLATRASDRPYAAVRLVRRVLERDWVALRILVSKLEPGDFGDEERIQRLVKFLDSSPSSKQLFRMQEQS